MSEAACSLSELKYEFVQVSYVFVLFHKLHMYFSKGACVFLEGFFYLSVAVRNCVWIFGELHVDCQKAVCAFVKVFRRASLKLNLNKKKTMFSYVFQGIWKPL